MKAFKGLLIKEIKITRIWFLVGIGILILSYLGGLGLSHYLNETVVMPIISIMVVVGHVFYLPGYLINSLSIEARTQLWLHNPNHGWMLFLAKLTAGTIYFLISFTVALLMADWQINHSIFAETFNQFAQKPFPNLNLIGAALGLTSLYFGIWFLFYWSLFHSLKAIPAAKPFRWPIVIGLWVLLTSASYFIQNLPFYKKLKNIGVIKLNSMKTFQFEAGKAMVSAGLVDTAQISIMNGIIYTVVSLLVFLAAVWLVERKVEV
ncbi:hypothetical protein [Bacillus sp. S/N-304-OC-R1]|uniref:hypothetical protein n=1 Tax=Bacillus sp. S/N-304-OC-R1 TaxID=2758034 RepID=UPI001C8E165A|nr:hypothetical protein [Bacillus sp. S/N-304-OC-R1]MBY0123907.1 hypothetical protein [Bacillus sp. S/N-304-OC-R1]